jgi:hypothetical protein
MALVLIGTLVTVGCGEAKLESRWRDREITVDGKRADWEGALITINDGAMDVGVLNDEANLYVCLVAATREDQIQMMLGGLTLWFDPNGGKEETFGIRFPLGHEPGGRKKRGDRSPIEQGLEELWKRIEAANELEIISGEHRSRETLASATTVGIEVKASQNDFALVYELKIPLRSGPSTPFGIDPGSETIGVGLETPKMERPDRPMRAGMGGMGRPGGGRGGKGGAMMGGRSQPSMPDPIGVWATIQLAQSPSYSMTRSGAE